MKRARLRKRNLTAQTSTPVLAQPGESLSLFYKQTMSKLNEITENEIVCLQAAIPELMRNAAPLVQNGLKRLVEALNDEQAERQLGTIKTYDESDETEEFTKTLRKMGFTRSVDGNDVLRLDEQGTVAEVEIDEADNALVDGIWLYESYDNPFHKRVIGFERYIDSIGDIVSALNHFVPQEAKDIIAKIKE